MKKIIFFITSLFYILPAAAQQDPEYTHYMYNMSIVNPAYATGVPAMMNFGGLYRTQWVGAVGAPKTYSFFGHSALTDKVEVGLSLQSDDIGDGAKKENNFYADFAYVLKLGGQNRLSLGLKAGFSSMQTNFNGFVLQSGDPATDAAFAENINVTKPNIGIGAYYFRDNFYTDSGVISLIVMLNILSGQKKSLSALSSKLDKYFSITELNFKVLNPGEFIKKIAQNFEGYEIDWLDGLTVFTADFWFNLRPSNTEPLLRLNIEAKDEIILGRVRKDLVNLIEKEKAGS